jgi:preprotein translocase subunit Sec63
MFIYLDAEDRLNKANDDLKRVTEHIEQERAVNKEVQRRQVNFSLRNIKRRVHWVRV